MECCLSSYHGWLHCDVSGVWYLATAILGWRPLMAGHMVALWRALFRLWWLPSRVVWATVGVAVSSSDMPSLSEGQRPNQDLAIKHRGATLEDLMVAWVSCQAKAPCLGTAIDDTHGCRALLEDVFVLLLSVSGLQV